MDYITRTYTTGNERQERKVIKVNKFLTADQKNQNQISLNVQPQGIRLSKFGIASHWDSMTLLNTVSE